jgi:beta-galactosidase
MKVRSIDPQFMAYQRTFIQKVYEQLGDLQITHGGPIVMVQMENELSAIDDYLAGLKDIFTQSGFNTQLATCDHHVDIWHKIDGLPGVLRGYNGLVPTDNNNPEMAEAKRQAGEELADQKLKDLAAVCGPQGYPFFTPESYTAWFSSWGARVAKKTVAQQVRDAQWLVDHPNVSFSYYVFDGGTNFGFNNGSNRFTPVATTYDYDAPVNELGEVTPKFKALRQLFIDQLQATPTDIPPDPKVIEIAPFTLSAGPSLIATLSKPTATSDDVLSMEDVDQSYGLIDYRKKFDTGVTGTLDIGPQAGKDFPRALDYAIVMLDGKVVGEAFDGYIPTDSFGPKNYQIKLDHTGPCTLDILVYNLGRNSVGITQEISRKGLIADPTLDGKDLQGWDIFSLPMNPPQVPASIETQGDGPVFYTGTFNLSDVGETYLDLRNFSFGAVWVNGHNLGRFWDVGADRGLYLPSVWEKQGDNQITVLELGTPPTTPQIKGVNKLVEEPATPFKPYHQL